MVEDSGVGYLLTTETLVESVPQRIGTTILLDAEREQIEAQPQSAPDSKCTPGNLIYCIYTSGSTGKPKGMLLEHRNVVRLMVNDQQPFSFTEADVWTMFHSYCFDFSVWEMYGALLYGGKLVIVAEPVMKDPSLFLELLVKQKVTVLNQTPTAFYNLAKEALRSGPPKLALRYVIFGGEALHPVQLKEWQQAYPGTKLINMYGITETTVHVTYKEITEREIEENRNNIGGPIPTTTTYVMDAKLRLLPVGVAGEICVGGEGVGRGYLGRDELTRQKFVANPYRPAERLYRSGDLAKLLPGGELLYLGRIDDQVQIRGFRVEPGEIKSHLLEHPQVAEAEVVARESKTESLELVAYVVPRAEVSVTALRSHLAETLPFYMVPTAFVMLTALPLTANGKVDRRALPDPDESRPGIEETFVAPRTPSETALSKIWEEILGLEQVGVLDNFFELGGHSLLATRVVSRVSDTFEIRVPLRAFFERPTVAGLADFVANAAQEHRETIPAIRRLPRGESLAPQVSSGTEPMKEEKLEASYPLSPMQQGMLVSSIHDRDSGVYLQQLVCALRESVDQPLLVTAWRQVIQRHSVLRTGFRWDGLEDPLQEVHGRPEPGFVSDDWSHLSAVEQEQRIDQFLDSDRRQGFELTAPPLMRVAFFKLGDRDYRMIWTFHHGLLDGRSHFLVIKELFDSYEGLCTGRPLQLKHPRPYSEYIDWLGKQDQAAAEVFWRASLRGFTTPTSLRVERTVEVDHVERHSSAEILISEAVTAELRVRAKESNVTLNNLVQASWALLLSRYSGEEEVLFGATRACRHWTSDGGDGMVGLFINTLPFRVRVQRDQQLRDWLKEVKAQHFALREFEHTPLLKIKEWSDVPPGTPLFNSVLVFEDYQMNKRLRALGGNWNKRDVKLLEQTNYPLTVAAYAESDLLLKIEYDAQRFDQATIRRLLEHLRTVLEGLAKNLDGPVRDLPFLTPAERQQLLIDWNQTATCQGGKTIAALFEQQVERTPENVAVVFENERLTYRELNERANQLAHQLRKRGVGPEVLVALCLEPSLEMVVCVLGTLKAGGAYVPLDPAYPANRLSFKLADSGVRVLLTQESLRAQLPSHSAEVIVVDTDWETIAREGGSDGKANPETICAPENLAYVIFTSGSTGKT